MDCSVFLNNLTTKPWLDFFKGRPVTHEEELRTFVSFPRTTFFSFSKMWPSHSGSSSVWRGTGGGEEGGQEGFWFNS